MRHPGRRFHADAPGQPSPNSTAIARPPKFNRRPRRDLTRINDRIRAPRVRVILSSTNEQLGILPVREALIRAKELGLDLVEVAPNADPPVCRIIDYGKFKYEQSKLKKGQGKNTSRLKEIKLRVRTDAHDYSVKLSHAEDFLDHGNKLKVQLQFRGREMAHPELGFELMQKVKADLSTMAHVDMEPKQSGRSINMTLSPLPSHMRKRKFQKATIRLEDLNDEDDEDDDEEDSAHADQPHDDQAGESPSSPEEARLEEDAPPPPRAVRHGMNEAPESYSGPPPA